MSQAVTNEIPDRLFEQLKRTAEISNRPIEDIIETSLAQSLLPLLEDIPAEYQTDVYPLLEMNVSQLQEEARRVFPAEQ